MTGIGGRRLFLPLDNRWREAKRREFVGVFARDHRGTVRTNSVPGGAEQLRRVYSGGRECCTNEGVGVEYRRAVSFGAFWDGHSWVSGGAFCFGAMNHLDGKAAVEAKAKMQEKAKRRELFAKQGKTLAKFSTSGTCVLTGSLRPRQRTLTGRLQVILKPPSTSAVLRRYEPRGLATKGPSKPPSLPATNTSPKVVFKINGNAATHNLQVQPSVPSLW
eukprot:COSAG02_NODE_1181_length_14030_cov_6.652143_2_plen_218_part_00